MPSPLSASLCRWLNKVHPYYVNCAGLREWLVSTVPTLVITAVVRIIAIIPSAISQELSQHSSDDGAGAQPVKPQSPFHSILSPFPAQSLLTCQPWGWTVSEALVCTSGCDASLQWCKGQGETCALLWLSPAQVELDEETDVTTPGHT
jgi:hypothetical protein